jgi:hypothetical protein
MKRRATILIIVIVLLAAFFFIGMPGLRMLKEMKGEDGRLRVDTNAGNFSGREVKLDITVEDICANPITGEVELECSNPDMCRSTCQTRGCKLYQLDYRDYEFVANRCYCICWENNKIVKALTLK